MSTLKRILFILMAAAYVLAGINHFWHPQTYLKMMPPWLPLPGLANTVTGLLEIILGLLLLPNASRNLAAWGIIILLVLIFPANLQMALNMHAADDPKLPYAIARLPLQLVLIWWAFSYTSLYAMKGLKMENES